MMINFSKQAGVTLIEVMISITLGVFFLVVAMQYLIAGQQTYQSQDTGSRINENARFALQFIADEARMGGFFDVGTDSLNAIYRGSCGTVDGQNATNCSDDVAGREMTEGDRLGIAMVAANGTDCIGNAVASPNARIANVFWVQEVNGISSLYCNGYDMTSNSWNDGGAGIGQPLVNGIDQMQVQYGILNNTTNSVGRYLNATQVQAVNAWDDVRSVKIALLVNSGLDTSEGERDSRNSGLSDSLLNAQYTNFSLLDSSYVREADDRRLRRVFTTTVYFNNVFRDVNN